MHADGKGDGRSIEEILASIRRLIADAPDATGTAPPELPSYSSLAETPDRDGGFEVPAMYRAPKIGDTANSEPTRGYVTPDQVRQEGASAFPEPPTDANRLEATQPKGPASEPWIDTLGAATRTLESMQSDAVQQGFHSASSSEGTAQAPQPIAPSSPSDAEISIPRTMVRCTDTVIGRMGQVQRQPDLNPPTPDSELPPLPSTAQTVMNEAPARGSGGGSSALGHTDVRMSKQLEDAAATALRPLLRDWLNRNMRVILEKALQDELDSTKRK